MKVKLGRALMALGLVCFLTGVGLLIFNFAQAKKAENAVLTVMPELVVEISKNQEKASDTLRRRSRLYKDRSVVDNPLGRRSAESKACNRACKEKHGKDLLYLRRADDGTSYRRRR